jgi:hypothetical protein
LFLKETFYMKRCLPIGVFLLVLISGLARSQAAIVVFPDRVTFGAALVGETVETWDDNAAGTVIPDGGMLDGVFYFTPGADDAIVTATFLPLSPPNTLGAGAKEFFTGAESITFTFPTPIIAFGISFNTLTYLGAGVTAVPEPMSMAIWGIGAIGLFGAKRLRRKIAK